MATKGNPVIARQGWPVIGLLLLLTVMAKMYVGWTPAAILLFILITATFIFRDPKRVIPPIPLAIVSPASGEVTAVEPVYDPWMKRQALKCTVRMFLWDVHSLRSPVEGKVMEQWSSRSHEPGIRRRYTYWLKTDEGDDVTLSFATGWLGSMLRLTLYCGERIGQGQPCGFLFFAGLIEVYLPETTRLEVKPGFHVDSGTAILGKFVHNPATQQVTA
jgi:phosphatidylserine decarboxylase